MATEFPQDLPPIGIPDYSPVGQMAAWPLLFVIPAQAGIQFLGTDSPLTQGIERNSPVLASSPS